MSTELAQIRRFARQKTLPKFGEKFGEKKIGTIQKNKQTQSTQLPEHKFKTDGLFTVILMRIPDQSSEKSSEKTWHEIEKVLRQKHSDELNKNEWKALEFIHERPSISIPEIANKLGLTTRAVEKNIKKLKDKELLEREGGGRGGRWKVLY